MRNLGPRSLIPALAALVPFALTAQTIALSPAASPSAGQPGITVINLTGAGFPAGTIQPTAVTVSLTPSAGGAVVTTPSSAVTTIVGTTRRVTFTIPNTISVTTPTAYAVSISGTTATNVTFASTDTAALTVNPAGQILSAAPATGVPGQTLSVAFTGAYTNFVQGSTVANFGAGIAVGGAAEGAAGPVTVTSATSAVAQLAIDAAASGGSRAVTVSTGAQSATLTAGFIVIPPPVLVHSLSLAAPGQAGNGFRIQYGGSMGSGSLAGNLMTLRITAPHGSTIASITDNFSDSYTLGVSVDSGSGGWVTAMYYLAGAPAGITQITVTYSASVADWHGAVMEYSGVAASSPVDGACSNHSTTIACSTAMTTTGANDLIVASMIGLSGNGIIWQNTMTGVTPGGSFFFDAADTQCSDADEEYVQASPGSVTPSFTATGNSESFNIVGMAFKAANAGTLPTGMYIRRQQHVQINGAASSETVYFVSSGNLLLAATDIGPSISTVTINGCAPSNAFAEQTDGTLYPQYFYLTSTANFSTNLHCTVSTRQQGQHGILVIYDIVGAAASPFDAFGPEGSGNGTTITNTLTPTGEPGIAFASENTGVGPTTGVGSGFIFDNTPYTGESDTGQLNNGDGWQHYFYTSASEINFTWTQANSSSYMQAGAIAFNAASASSASGSPAPAGPSVPTNLAATASSSSRINLSWTASTDANYSPGQISYNVFRNGAQVGTTGPGTVTYQDTGLARGTTYMYAVSAYDPAGNNSAQSASVSATTPAGFGGGGDGALPTVSITVPASNATVSGTISVSAAASASLGVAMVEFYLDSVLQVTDTSSPYIWSWNTASSSNGSHTLLATAYDAAGNIGTSPTVVVTVSNGAPDTTPPTVPTNLSATATSSSQIGLSWTASTDPDNTPSQIGYNVFRNGAQAGTTAPGAVTYQDIGLTAGTTYTYTLTASDPAGNTSAPSAPASATTPVSTAATPTLVQSLGLMGNSANNNNPGNGFRVHLPNSVLAGNLVVVGVTYPNAAGAPTITDNAGTNTWVMGLSCANTSIGTPQAHAIFYSLNTAAGTQAITVSFGAPQMNVNITAAEFYNVAPAAAVDGSGSCLTNQIGPNVAAGNLTTTADGDLIYNYAMDESNGILGDIASNISGIGFGAGWTGLYGETIYGSAAQYEVQSAQGAVNPGITFAQTSPDAFGSLALAFKAAQAGAAPGPGIRILRELTVEPAFLTTPFVFPSSGNLIAAMSAEACSITGITDNYSNTYTTLPVSVSLYPQLFHADQAVTANALQGTIARANLNGTCLIEFYDIAGAAASPLDTSATCPAPSMNYGGGACSNFGTTSGNAIIADAPDIAPSTSNGLVVEALNQSIGPVSDSTNGTFDFVWYTGSGGTNLFNNGDAASHYYNPDGSTIRFGYLEANNGTLSAWQALAVAFKGGN